MDFPTCRDSRPILRIYTKASEGLPDKAGLASLPDKSGLASLAREMLHASAPDLSGFSSHPSDIY